MFLFGFKQKCTEKIRKQQTNKQNQPLHCGWAIHSLQQKMAPNSGASASSDVVELGSAEYLMSRQQASAGRFLQTPLAAFGVYASGDFKGLILSLGEWWREVSLFPANKKVPEWHVNSQNFLPTSEHSTSPGSHGPTSGVSSFSYGSNDCSEGTVSPGRAVCWVIALCLLVRLCSGLGPLFHLTTPMTVTASSLLPEAEWAVHGPGWLSLN